MIFVRLEESARLAAERLHVRADRDAANLDLAHRAGPILEIGIDERTFLEFDQFDQRAQAPPHGFQHRQGHVPPELIGLDFLDQRHFGGDHRHVGQLLEEGRNLADALFEAGERIVRPHERELRAVDRQIELLGG